MGVVRAPFGPVASTDPPSATARPRVPTPRLHAPRAVTVGVALAVLVACGDAPERPPASTEDTSDTLASEEVSQDADDATADEPPDADDTALASAAFDGIPLPVTAVRCDGPELVAELDDGGQLLLSTEDGATTAELELPGGATDDGPRAWVGDSADAEQGAQVTASADGATGQLELRPQDSAGDETADLSFDLPCD